MKKRIIITTSIIAIILMIASFAVIRHQMVQKRNEEVQTNIMRLDNERYMYCLGIDGEFSYGPEQVVVNEMHINYFKLTGHVALYNEFKEEELTIEQVLEEYEAFCKGEYKILENERTVPELLEALAQFNFGDGYLTWKYSYETYSAYRGHYLRNVCGVNNITEATNEQLQEAAEYAAERIHEEIENEK